MPPHTSTERAFNRVPVVSVPVGTYSGLARVDQAGYIIVHITFEWLLVMVIGVELHHTLGAISVIAVVEGGHSFS